MATINDILMDYTTGKTDLPTTNQALKEAGAKYHLDPGKNALTEEEIRATTVGTYPDMANGWGLLDTGTGSLDKVEVRGGRLVNMDCGEMYALCLIAGKTYRVRGAELAEE
jgi:hypothetical protein